MLASADRATGSRRVIGREPECQVLVRLLANVCAGRSELLVIRGEAGIGKTALLDYLVDRASGCRVIRATGHESELAFAFSGLHQFCAPLLDRLDRLPTPQRDALGTALGLRAAPPPDRFLVGLAVLGLLADVAEDQPVVCVVDDMQWFDLASAQTLTFVARRLLAEQVAMVFTVRESVSQDGLADIPELVVKGLRESAARDLLNTVVRGPIDERVRTRIIEETRGNPLALLELPRDLTPTQLAGGFGLPSERPTVNRIEEAFLGRLAQLPPACRQLVLVAAAEPLGDVALLWRAANHLAIGPDAAATVETAGILEIGIRVRFQHPHIRSAIYRTASIQDRQRVHEALAAVTDAESEPDRYAWHRAHASNKPDEDVAEALARSAGQAQARGGIAAAAAFLDRAAVLSPDPKRRAVHALAAAQASLQAGALQSALSQLSLAEEQSMDERHSALAQLLRAQISFNAYRASDGPPLLLKAAQRLEPLDAELARDTYLDAFAAVTSAGHTAQGPGLDEIASAARRALRPKRPACVGDLLLECRASLTMDGYAAAMPIAKRMLAAFRTEQMAPDQELRWLSLAKATGADLWDDETTHTLSLRHVELARSVGALSQLPRALNALTFTHLIAGDLGAAASLVEEARLVKKIAGTDDVPYGALGLSAWQGHEGAAVELRASIRAEVETRGEGNGIVVTQWAFAVLLNGLARYEEALAAAQQASANPDGFFVAKWALTELVEAAARCHKPDLATNAVERLAMMAHATQTDWALANAARARALVCNDDAADDLYREAIERLGRTRPKAELARTHLLYGEWLRRRGLRREAREQLKTAYELFSAMGMNGFAERSRREIAATGETVRARIAEARTALTAQESHIAGLAADGRTNPEIGAELFISPRTVEWHLRKVYLKFGIASRKQLSFELANLTRMASPA